MSNLLSTLISSSNALRAFDQALNVVQNNVANASTPGYAKQVQVLSAERFSPEAGLSGGVLAGPVISRRSEYAEQAVRRQQSAVGFADQRRADLERIEPLFAPTANAGLPGALSKFFQSFSQVAVSPNDRTIRQTILDRAGAVAQSFRETASGIQSARDAADRQIDGTVASINSLLDRIRDFNIGRRGNAETVNDAGVDANLHQALEDLAELVDFQVLEAPDHSLTVLLAGSEPAVLGDHSFPISATITDSGARIYNQQGAEITGSLKQGRLGALLDERNSTLTGYLGNLDQLAASFATEVNGILAGGLDQNGNAPAQPLFVLDPTYPALRFETNALAPEDLALAAAGAPGGSGNALDIAALSSSKAVNGFTFTEFFGTLGARLGRAVNEARDTRDTQISLLSQAKNIRDQQQAVSLDEEATALMTFQKAYQASSRFITVINELSETVINLLR